MRTEDLNTILQREGLTSNAFVDLSTRWARLLAKDAWLAENHRAQLNRAPSSSPPPSTSDRLESRSPVAVGFKDDPVIFPGEKLAKLSDFVRFARAARSANFLALLHRESMHPSYYAHMCKRFDAVRKADAAIDREYRAMVEGL
jgi:hypothetical protein